MISFVYSCGRVPDVTPLYSCMNEHLCTSVYVCLFVSGCCVQIVCKYDSFPNRAEKELLNWLSVSCMSVGNSHTATLEKETPVGLSTMTPLCTTDCCINKGKQQGPSGITMH